MSNKFKFQTTTDFEIDANEAAEILADPFPNRALSVWLNRTPPCPEDTDFHDSNQYRGFSLDQLLAAFGKHLAEQKIAERKQLTDITV